MISNISIKEGKYQHVMMRLGLISILCTSLYFKFFHRTHILFPLLKNIFLIIEKMHSLLFIISDS